MKTRQNGCKTLRPHPRIPLSRSMPKGITISGDADGRAFADDRTNRSAITETNSRPSETVSDTRLVHYRPNDCKGYTALALCVRVRRLDRRRLTCPNATVQPIAPCFPNGVPRAARVCCHCHIPVVVNARRGAAEEPCRTGQSDKQCAPTGTRRVASCAAVGRRWDTSRLRIPSRRIASHRSASPLQTRWSWVCVSHVSARLGKDNVARGAYFKLSRASLAARHSGCHHPQDGREGRRETVKAGWMWVSAWPCTMFQPQTGIQNLVILVFQLRQFQIPSGDLALLSPQLKDPL